MNPTSKNLMPPAVRPPAEIPAPPLAPPSSIDEPRALEIQPPPPPSPAPPIG